MYNTGIKAIRLFFGNAVVLLCCITAVHGQNRNNNITLTANNTSFSLTNVSAIETQQVRTNAFQIEANSKASNTYSIHARVSSSTSSTGTPLPASMLALRLNSVNPTVTANFNTITLNTTDQLLQQVTTTQSPVTYNYDLLAGPVGYTYAPANYNLTILFTMTQL